MQVTEIDIGDILRVRVQDKDGKAVRLQGTICNINRWKGGTSFQLAEYKAYGYFSSQEIVYYIPKERIHLLSL